VRLLQLSVARENIVLLLLLAVHCAPFLKTDGADIPEHMTYYIACLSGCENDYDKCLTDCETNNMCEGTRHFCKKVCVRIVAVCNKNCVDETVRLYKKQPTLIW